MNIQSELLENVCEILDSQRIPVTATDRKPGPYPYYGANGVQDYVAEYIFDDELVLLAEDGGNFGSSERPIAYRVSGKCWVNNHAHVLKPRVGVNVDYLCYSLMFYNTNGLVNGATRQKLTQAAMRKMQIQMRNVEGQLRIVDEVSRIEKLIYQRKKQLQRFDDLVKSQFIEMFGKIDESLFVPLSKVGKISTGSTPSMRIPEYYEKRELPFIKPSDIGLEVSRIYRAESAVDNRAKPICRMFGQGAVLVTCIGTIGKIGISEIEGTCNQQINFIEPYETIDSTFLAYTIESRKIQLIEMANAPVVPIINKSLFSTFRIPVAKAEEQKQFARFVEQTDKSKVLMVQAIKLVQILIKLILNIGTMEIANKICYNKHKKEVV